MPRAIPANHATKIEAGVTTFCFCWKLTLRDASVLAYTSNIDSVTVDAIEYLPGAGLLSTNLRSELGTGIDSASVLGVIDDDTITAADLLNGAWDDARIEIFLVDYTAPADGIIELLTGFVGELRNEIVAFVAEVRSLLQRASQQVGYLCSASCKAQLGDAACGVVVSDDVGSGVTSVIDERTFRDSGLTGAGDGFYKFGLLTWTSGPNTGGVFEVKSYTSATGEFELQETPAATIANGHDFSVTAGCDKLLATCLAKFDNVLRFRGEPFIPGTDAVLKIIHS